MSDIKSLQDKLLEFRKARDWEQFHNPKDLAISLALEAAEAIEELIKIAKEIRNSDEEAESLGLSADEIAFYDALVQNGSARKVMGDKQLRDLARILVERVRKSVTVDWTLRASAQALLRREVKRALREYGYPPDEEKVATELVLEQATLFGDEWSKEI